MGYFRISFPGNNRASGVQDAARFLYNRVALSCEQRFVDFHHAFYNYTVAADLPAAFQHHKVVFYDLVQPYSLFFILPAHAHAGTVQDGKLIYQFFLPSAPV